MISAIKPKTALLFLIAVFGFLFWAGDSFAGTCVFPPAWNNSTCTVDIEYTDPCPAGQCSNLSVCERVIGNDTAIPDNCSTATGWVSTGCNCSGLSYYLCSGISVPIGSGLTCSNQGTNACQICSKATDSAGNTGYGTPQFLNIDYTKPTTTITPNGVSCSGSNTNFSLSCSDSNSGCASTQYKIIASTATCDTSGLTTGTSGTVSCSSGQTCQMKVCYRSTDNAGNEEDIKTSNIFKIDKQIPYQVSWNPVSRDWGSTDVSVTVQYADDGCGLSNTKYCWTTGASCTPTTNFPNTWGGTASQSANGTWNLCVTATDLGGNVSSPNPSCKGPYRIDKEAPTTNINPNGSDWTKNDVGFTLSCSDSYSGCNITQYKVIDSAQTCDTTGLTTGSSGTVTCSAGSVCQKKVCFRSTDVVGNIESIKTSNVFKIDKKNPTQTIWSPASRGCGNSDVSVTIQYSDTDSGMSNTKYCWTTGASCTPVTSFTNPDGGTAAQSSSGNWTLCVAATDVAGNTASDCKGLYVIDKNPPSESYRYPASYGWYYVPPYIDVRYTDDMCGVVGGKYCWSTGTTCTPNIAVSGANWLVSPPPADGAWTLCTSGNDGAGNWSSANCGTANAYKLDRVAPTLQSRVPGSRDWDVTDIVVTVTYTDDRSGVGSTKYCWTTGASCDPFYDFTNGGTITQTQVGEWTLCTWAYDVAGNRSTRDCSAQGAYKKNAKPTCTGLSGSPTSGYAPLSVIFTGSGSDSDGTIVNYQWDFNGDGVWDATTTSSVTGYTYTSAGNFCAKLRVQDNRGAWSDTPGSCPTTCTQQITVSLDSVVPTVSVTGAPAGWQNSNASAGVSCTDAASGCDTATYRLKTYSSNPGTCSAVYADYTLTTPQTISSHLWVCAAAKDNVGNAGFSSLTEFRIDKLNPQVSSFDVFPKSPSWINNTTPNATISWTVTDTGDSHLLRVEVWRTPDLAGAPDPNQWQKVGSDYVAPAGLDSWSSSGSDSPSNGTFWYGIHVLDNASNMGTESSPIKVLVDKTDPSTNFVSPTPADDSWQKDDFSARVMDSDTGGSGLKGGSGCTYLVSDLTRGVTVKNGTRVCGDYTFSVPVGPGSLECQEDRTPPIGQSTCHVETTAYDNAGNLKTVSRNFKADYTPPVVGSIIPTNAVKGVPVTLNASSSDSVSQIFGCWLYVESALTTSTVNYSSVPCTSCNVSAQYTFNEIRSYGNVFFMCMDAAQNYTSGSPVTVQVAAPPTLSVDLSANPSVGVDSLYDVDLTATASGTMSGTTNYKFDCTDNGSWELEVNNSSLTTYTATDLCDYASVGTYTAKVFIERGEGCGGVVECTAEYLAAHPLDFCCQEKRTTIDVVANQPPTCRVNVPDTTPINQLIDIGVGGSTDPEGQLSTVKFCSDKNAANPNGQCDESWTQEYGWNTPSGDWTDATSKIMKWSFSQPGTYEVWTTVKDNVNQTAACFDTISVTECIPGSTKTCTSSQGCNHTITCQTNGTWPACPNDQCVPGSNQGCGTAGTQTCTASCTWGICVEPGDCTLPAPSCSTCQHPVCSSGTWSCQPDAQGTDCGDCRECNGSGSCVYVCPEACVNDSCASCSAYDGGCGYGYCGPLETPSWSYYGGICQYSCQYNVTCEGENPPPPPEEPCERYYPDVYLYPASQSATAGQQLNYTVSVTNNDSQNCTASNFSLTKSCPSGWSCSLDFTSLNISPAQSQSTILRVTSPAPPYTKGDYQVSSTATNNSSTTYSSTGYAIYQVANNPPTSASACHPQGCAQASGSCSGYTWSSFCLKNNASDIDGIGDIKNSIWMITGTMTDTSNCLAVLGNPICNWTLPSNFTAGTYSAQLYVEDKAGATSTSYKPFTVLQDAIAEFDCSLNEEGPWQECDTLRASEGEVVYFRNKSIASDGATFTSGSWSWTFEDGTPAASALQHPSASFQVVDAGSGQVTLTVVDSNSRTDNTTHQVWVTKPLPEWQEAPPF